MASIFEPADAFNEKLRGHVFPADWENPVPQGRYNLVVLGAGTAGLVTAAAAAGLGAKVALVERRHLGGDCLNVGCVPSKALLAASRAVASARAAAAFSVTGAQDARADFGEVMRRMRRLRSDISPHDSAARFKSLGVDVYLGAAKFTGRDTVEVGGSTLRFAKAVIATGARAAAPIIPGLDTVDYLTNETLFSLETLPRRLAVIGAGPIGCEMAQAFARFGSEVFLIEAAEGVMPREDRDAAALVRDRMASDGVHVICGGKNLKLARAGSGTRFTVDVPGCTHDETVDAVLVAVGRAPNVEGLDLEKAGVLYDRNGVKIDDHFRTANPAIYAAGDICSPYQFTHAADFMARAVVRNALFFGRERHSRLLVPWCTYTSPEVAQVGLTPAEAKKQGVEIDTFTQPFSGVDRAILEGETEGFVRVHVARGTDRIVGATLVGSHAGDMIGEYVLAIKHGVGLGSLASVIHPYPTQGEAIRKTGDLYNKTRFTPTVAKLFRTLLAWRR